MTTVFWLICTIAVYWVSKKLYKAYSFVLLTPLLVTPVIIIAMIELNSISYDTYNEGAGWLTKMVEPAAIAMGVTLYKHFDILKRNAYALLVSVGCGAVAAIVTSAGLSRLFGLDSRIMESLAPRSATTPIAVTISSMLGGIPAVTAVATLITGLLGFLLGPAVVKWFRIRHPVARGALLGTSAHSAGISKAVEYDAVTGSAAGIAMIFTAFVTLCAAPWLVNLLQ